MEGTREREGRKGRGGQVRGREKGSVRERKEKEKEGREA